MLSSIPSNGRNVTNPANPMTDKTLIPHDEHPDANMPAIVPLVPAAPSL